MNEGKTQEAAAAAAGMSVRSGRRWQRGSLPSKTKTTRTWRTRQDPFEEIWTSDVVPILAADEAGRLQAKTILEVLIEAHPDTFSDKHLRTLQRRVRDWRALHGPDKDVVFPQEHPPGREGAFDFTHCDELEVTIAGEAFAHLLFVFRLSFSGWLWAGLAYSETFEALLSGLQDALWSLGGAPRVARHDNLSAATHELRKSGGRALTSRFADVLDHYDLESTRIKPRHAQENGGVERANGLLKTALDQALRVRGRRDFDGIDDYKRFVDGIVASLNRKVAERFAVEREHLRPLPPAPLPSYTTHHPKVRRWSTIRVTGRLYSVPSRLIGHTVEVHQHADCLDVFYDGKRVETMPRVRGDVHIDYRHIIWSLVRKPGAFARYKFREQLFPTARFRQAYDRLYAWRGERADVEYVRILHLAASTMESTVDTALELLLAAGDRFDYAAVKDLAQPEVTAVPDVRIGAPDLEAYDQLLGGMR